MMDASVDCNRQFYLYFPEGMNSMQMKLRGQELRKRQRLTQNPQRIDHGSI